MINNIFYNQRDNEYLKKINQTIIKLFLMPPIPKCNYID